MIWFGGDKFMKCVFLALIVLLNGCGTVQHDETMLCYMPFDRESFGPIDKKLIEKTKCAGVDDTDILYKKLSEYLDRQNQGNIESAPSRFDEKRVRLKFASKSGIYYVDADGVVELGTVQYRLRDDNKKAISEILASAFDYHD